MNPSDWEKPIKDLLGDPERMKTLGDNGCRAVQTHYSWKAICKKIENTLERLASLK
jgi:glycosyltransferase involved in cell wall biosynthesis